MLMSDQPPVVLPRLYGEVPVGCVAPCISRIVGFLHPVVSALGAQPLVSSLRLVGVPRVGHCVPGNVRPSWHLKHPLPFARALPYWVKAALKLISPGRRRHVNLPKKGLVVEVRYIPVIPAKLGASQGARIPTMRTQFQAGLAATLR